jgi:hypothetical protein
MKETKPQGDIITEPFPRNTHDETRITEEDSSPPGASGWNARLRRRWKSMLKWLAQGAEHACPT